ncbi:MATE family efflux transporter [Butyricicoccus sp. 1XD8-22]|nr:MATE family efflux transporter [Butyricicoccus sp. 1XD8-22]
MNEKTVDYLNGKLFPMILKFSAPAAVSLLVTAVYNIVDRIFVGNFNGTSALAGLSVCFPLSYMMMAFALMCSAGGSTFFSLFSGQDEPDKMNKSFGNAFVLVCVFEIVLSVLLLLFPDPFLKIFGVTETSYLFAILYYRIVALGCLFQGLSQLFCDFVRVSGKPILGMCVTGIGAATNIILDAVFIIIFDWGVAGAAAATVIGQIFSTLFGAYLVFGNRTLVCISKQIFRLDKKLCIQIISCGFAFWVAQMAMGFISLVYNSQFGKYNGDVAISVYAVVSSIMTFVIMPASGISQGIQPIIGNNYGAGNYKRVMETLYQATLFSVSITCIIWLAVLFFPRQILAAFGGTEEMFQIGVTGLRINFCITPVLGFVMLATTFFQSINRPTPSIVITVLRQVVFLVPFLYIFPAFWDVNGIFFAQPISDMLATLLSLHLVWKEKKHMMALKR